MDPKPGGRAMLFFQTGPGVERLLLNRNFIY
jgi:hypothetical protein